MNGQAGSAPPAASDNQGIVLAVDGLVKRFAVKGEEPVAALRSVTLEARYGEVTGLVGADGAGKTTLIRIAAGLLRPTSGSVSVLGLDCLEHTLEIQSMVGYMPQKFGLYQDLTVAENMALYADLQGVARDERQERNRRLLEMTDLAPYISRKAGALSGGMKQKLGLACALIKSPRLLLLDEPTVGVDPVSRRELWRIVWDLVERNGIGVFVSTAYLDEAERCNRIVVLHDGEVLGDGTPRDFTKQVAQRVSLVSPGRGSKARRIYARLAGRDHVVDATIHSGVVRLVTDGTDASAVVASLDDSGVGIEPAEARFEDAFMSMIPRSQQQLQVGGDASSFSSAADERQEETVVETRELGKRFGDFEAVKKLSFSVRRGEIFGLLGPNGAGKSTTFRMLCGLLPATSGEIEVAGRDLRRSRAKGRARLGYMAQQFSLYGQLSVRENLRFFGKAYGLSSKRLRNRLDWAFTEFSLGTWRNTAAAGLPGGFKQRLAMAAALLHEPEILFLDEPTSGVDPFARREFWLRINTFAEQGVTVVVTTHFMEEAEYCDRLLIMSQGNTLAVGTPAEIRAMARSSEQPQPSMDDAFIALAEGTAGRQPGVAEQ